MAWLVWACAVTDLVTRGPHWSLLVLTAAGWVLLVLSPDPPDDQRGGPTGAP